MYGGGVNKASKRGSRGRKAFTLAEVLITLTIIGFVAAMTIPLVTASHKKVETSAKLKKFYNMFTEAVSMAENDLDATTDKWDLKNTTSKEFFETYLKDYIKYSQIVTDEDSGVTKFPGFDINESNPMIILDDGMKFQISNYAGSHTGYYVFKDIYVDINGEQKPNIYGRDIFAFSISIGNYKEKNLNHMFINPNYVDLTRKQLKNSCTCINYCDEFGRCDYLIAAACLTLIRMDGWEIKDDYPCKI